MTYWEKVAAKLSIPGLALLVLGALVGYEAPKLSRLVFKEKGEKLAAPTRFVGLALAVFGALILLDVFPNL